MTADELDGRVQRDLGAADRHRCRPWPSVTTSCSTTRASGPATCADDRLVRPAAIGAIATPRPSRCARAGARSRCSSATGTGRVAATCASRTTGTTTATARTSCGASSRASRRARTRATEGWARLRIWGMGIASQDITGDGYPEVYLTSQGDNKLQSLADGPSAPTLRGHRLATGRDRARPVRGWRRTCPPRHGIRSSRTSTTMGSLDLFVSKGNVEHAARLRHEGPEQPPHRAGRRHLRRGRRGGRASSATAVRRGAALVDLNRRWAARPRPGHPPRERPAVAQRRVGRRGGSPSRWATGWRWTSTRRRRTATRSGPGSRSGPATGDVQRGA